MAQSNASLLKIAGLALMVVGACLGYWGYEMSQAVGSQISEALTGNVGDAVMQRYIGGAVSFVVGTYLFVKS